MPIPPLFSNSLVFFSKLISSIKKTVIRKPKKVIIKKTPNRTKTDVFVGSEDDIGRSYTGQLLIPHVCSKLNLVEFKLISTVLSF